MHRPSKQQNIRVLYKTLSETVRAILAHDDCPQFVGDQLADMMDNIGNEAGVLDSVLFAEVLLPRALNILTEAEQARPRLRAA